MFLTKDLMLDWRLGEAYFAEQLIDVRLEAIFEGMRNRATTDYTGLCRATCQPTMEAGSGLRPLEPTLNHIFECSTPPLRVRSVIPMENTFGATCQSSGMSKVKVSRRSGLGRQSTAF